MNGDNHTRPSRRPTRRAAAWVLAGGLLLASCGGTSTLTESTSPADTPTAATPTAPASTTPAPTATATATATKATSDAAETATAMPYPTPPTATPIPSPTAQPTAAEVSDRCEIGPNDGDTYNMQVVDVARDDPDGGLVVHADVGVSAAVVGVFPWNTNQIHWRYGLCEILPSGAMWVKVHSNGLQGWVNARYLGRRLQATDDLAATPCVLDASSVIDPELEAQFTVDSGSPAAVHVDNISVQTSPACDRIVFELANNLDNDRPGPATAADEFPIENIETIEISAGAIEVRLAAGPDLYIDLWPEVWRDDATDELNAALVYADRGDETIRVGFGTGTASVRVANDPARLIVDVVQQPTPLGTSVGPLTVGGAIIFDPITSDGSPVTGPFNIRGWSRGFEASSSLRLATWDQDDASLPENWNGTILGETAQGVGAVIVPEPPFTNDEGMWYFMTQGIFDFKFNRLEPGAYQLMVSPDTGCGGPFGVVQQFHVGDPNSAKTAQRQPANWFAVRFGPDELPEGTPVIVGDATGERTVDWPTNRC